MTDFIFYSNPTVSLACVPGGGRALFPLDAAACVTGVHPEMLRYYCRLGLIEASQDGSDGEPLLDEDAIQEVRRIEHFRRNLGVGRRALPLVCELWHNGERMKIALRFLRDPSEA
jgi:DNA-binding transcriptional MerR regulator